MIFDPSLTGTAKLIYTVLAAHAGNKEYCFPSYKTICKEAGISKDSFYKHLQILVDAGYVSKDRYLPGSDGRYKSITYTLRLRVEK